MEETDGCSIFPAFGTLYVSLFVVDYPYETARRLFEAFLLKGQAFLLKLIDRVIKAKQKEIL